MTAAVGFLRQQDKRRRRHPVGTRRHHLEQVRLGKAAAGLSHPRAHRIARGCMWHEDHEAVVPGDAGTPEREVVDGEFEFRPARGPTHVGGWRDTARAPRDSRERTNATM